MNSSGSAPAFLVVLDFYAPMTLMPYPINSFLKAPLVALIPLRQGDPSEAYPQAPLLLTNLGFSNASFIIHFLVFLCEVVL